MTHLVRLPVNLRALAAFAVANGASDDDGGYALHLALRRRFGAAGPQPFRFFDEHRSGPHLLGYAGDADALADAAALPSADSELAEVFGPLASRPMPDAWREGARYGFEVRVRPVVRFGKARRERRADAGAWQPRAGEIDAFVAACERATPVAEGGEPVNREAVYVDWLERQLAAAATLEGTEQRLLRRTRTRRATHARAGETDHRTRRPPVEGPDAVMAGTLTIREPAAFARALARGVGRHAAFGFGMLLLSPARN